jgi:hypothetical protein
MNPLKTFIIYARSDEDYKKQLLLHLRPLVSRKAIEVWHDGNILPGEQWEKAIMRELKSSDLVLVLVSADSLGSDIILTELETAIERRIRIVPIIVSSCNWKSAPIIGDLIVISYSDMRSSFSNPNNAWVEVVREINEVIKALYEQRARPLAPQIAEEKRQLELQEKREEELKRQKQEEAERQRLARMDLERQRREDEAAHQERTLRREEAEASRRPFGFWSRLMSLLSFNLPVRSDEVPIKRVNILFSISRSMILAKPNECIVRITNNRVSVSWLAVGLSKKQQKESETMNISTDKMMSVRLQPMPTQEKELIVHALSPEQQLLESQSYTEWKFIVVPQAEGDFTLILTVLRHHNLSGRIQASKAEKSLYRTISVKARVSVEKMTFEEYSSPAWTLDLSHRMKQWVNDGLTDKALEVAVNVASIHQPNSENEVRIMLANWQEAKRVFNLNQIDFAEYNRHCSRINGAVLDIVSRWNKEFLQ